MNRKVVVTGISLLTPLGLSTEETWTNLCNGETGFTPVSDERLKELGVKECGRISLKKNNKREKNNNRWLSFFNLLFDELVSNNLSVLDRIIKAPFLIGSSFFGIEKNKTNISINKIIKSIKRQTNIKGRISFYSGACASGNVALISGFRLIQSGLTDFVICAGIDTLSDFLFAGFYALRNLAKDKSIPFSKKRAGLTLAEGGGMLILESLDSAIKRGAKIYSYIVGAAQRIDITSPIRPDKNGKSIILTITDALNDATINPKQIECINSHGTATILNDEAEAKAISFLFKHKPPIQAFKSFWGHAMGASSIIEAGLTALTLDREFLIKIRGLFEPLDDNNFLMKNEIKKINYAINNGFGFGGINTTVVFKRFE